MLSGMALIRILKRDAPALKSPVVVAAFDGWVDAGRAATTAGEQLAEGGALAATFDADAIFDYRSRRPMLDIVDGSLIGLEWPELTVRAVRLGERDLLILSGPEPDYRWRELATEVVAMVQQFEATTWISLGAIPVATPHTRPVRVLGTASASGLLPPEVTQGPEGTLRVPSALVSVLELAVARARIPALGFFAQVPHYISAAYPNASIALLEHVGRFLGIEPPLGTLPQKALETRSLLDAATTADDSTKAYVARLEEMADEARLPEGDDLIADIERFLRERGGGPGSGRPN
ncbi:MAG: carboxylate--amine ligase [Chloroflexi bacterium]|nr:MAG: carboxylate--amine ligase [Chloroflexota bacterium]